jgi:hypothetical protein
MVGDLSLCDVENMSKKKRKENQMSILINDQGS